jgi:hypothetical protein
MIARTLLAAGLMFAMPSVHAVVFDAYKDTLEADLLCKEFPRTNVRMHFQMLKETGVIPQAAQLGAVDRLYEFKAAAGFSIFGFPLQSIAMAPGSRKSPPGIVATVSASPSAVAARIKGAATRAAGAEGSVMEGKHFFWEGLEKGFQISVSPTKDGRGAAISCGPFVP